MNRYTKCATLLVLAAAAAAAAPTKKWNFGNPDSDQQLFWELLNACRLTPEAEIERVFSSPALTFGYPADFLANAKADVIADVVINDRWYEGWRSPVAYRSDLTPLLQKAVDGVNNHTTHDFVGDIGNLLVYSHASGAGLNGIEGYYADRLIRLDPAIIGVDAGWHSWIQVYSGTYLSDPTYSIYGAASATLPGVKLGDDIRRQLVGCVFEDRNSNGRYDLGEGVSGVRITPSIGEYYTETAVGGGYVIDFPRYAGAMTVTASGGALAAAVTKETTIGKENAKLDFVVTPAVTSAAVNAGAAVPALGIANFAPSNAAIYEASGVRAIVGLATASKFVGPGTEVVSNVTLPQTGYTYDQILLQGSAITVTADAGQITRVSFIDLSNDIVQLEFSGAGALTVVLENATGPATAVNYNQPSVSYMKGHASIVIVGANETTNVSVFTVGTVTAVNQALFKARVQYDGIADIASLAILSTNGKFGGLRAANTSFFASKGLTGIYAPNVKFTGPVFVGEISAYDSATPVLMIGAGDDVRLTGGDLAQPNNKAVEISGIVRLQTTGGTTSHGLSLPAQTVRGRLVKNGADVTAEVTAN